MTRLDKESVIEGHRAKIAELDLKVLSALNARIALVAELKAFKAAQGLAFYDATQEDRVLARLCEANRGPMSDAGVREVFGLILDLAKREAAGFGTPPAE